MAESEEKRIRKRKKPTVEGPFLDQAEAAAYLRVSESHYIDHVRPHVPVHRIGTKPIFHRKHLDEFMEAIADEPPGLRRPRRRPGLSLKARQIAEELRPDEDQKGGRYRE